ncbi:hypothetical protein TVAG_103190 [Trichomonas vaginalis G3]|uniref:Uncharacterized protein n=1 Tax=Trichomonas vaginalis (strain ATCC PRA-98 / G3) TaxID=412133 RepID=A2EKN0_TRIV3|nr:hypothetical protein TVAGG3_0931460 [Trichomonas vaginalis G3]EAY06769.1 hypothetical protein TVAG_103190 [Trichomonas vaginalis G3]KAI5485870.1 hypothetical protein TVAGG3_0931460 [Trichomonas vaginalis G3]|eukprot:XP_001318992.1 hypothetical protein [Trichomonas vaginalis G3]
MDQNKESHYIKFAGANGLYYIPGSTCDFDLLGFIPSDKSLQLVSITPIKHLSGSKALLQMAPSMLEKDMDGLVLGDGQYVLRAFKQNELYLLCLCKPTLPLFPGALFDGQYFIKPFNIFNGSSNQ